MLVAAVPLTWLLPNHYLPWASAWQDGAALALIFGAATLAKKSANFPLSWVAAVAVASGSVCLQWITGRINFGGDALMVLVYGGALLLSLGLGATLPALQGGSRVSALEAVALLTVLSAISSVGIALVQWTGSVSLGIWGADLPPGARPFANVSQPNHLSTLAFLGVCGLLLLRETAGIGAVGFWGGAIFLLIGMVLAASRTGWVQVAALVVLALLFQRRAAARMRVPHLAGLGLLYAVLTLVWPLVNEVLLYSGGRGVMQQIDGGARMPLWIALLDAVGREPWWGYGWQQVATAQQAVALDHPPIQRHFEHSHNIALDLLLWAGIPVGGSIIALCAGAVVLQARALRDPRALWSLAAALGVILHGLLELPLEYAYFLLPMGLALGAANALDRAGPQVRCGVWVLRLSGIVGLALLAAIAAEYLEAEQNHRLLRLESARIGTTRIESKGPDLHLLTQLKGFLEFARVEARPSMSLAEVDRMRVVAQRYPFAPVMLRYALAAGLNGRPAEARLTLARLCSMHPPARCDEARESWLALQARYPVLERAPPP